MRNPILRYGLGFLVILIIEIGIALFVRDRFVRPYGGDVLVIVLLYFFVMFLCAAFPRIGRAGAKAIKKEYVAIGVLLFAYCVEFLQALHIIRWLQLEENALARVILGTSFGWWDMLAYTVGCALLLLSIRWFGRETGV